MVNEVVVGGSRQPTAGELGSQRVCRICHFAYCKYIDVFRVVVVHVVHVVVLLLYICTIFEVFQPSMNGMKKGEQNIKYNSYGKQKRRQNKHNNGKNNNNNNKCETKVGGNIRMYVLYATWKCAKVCQSIHNLVFMATTTIKTLAIQMPKLCPKLPAYQ